MLPAKPQLKCADLAYDQKLVSHLSKLANTARHQACATTQDILPRKTANPTSEIAGAVCDVLLYSLTPRWSYIVLKQVTGARVAETEPPLTLSHITVIFK